MRSRERRRWAVGVAVGTSFAFTVWSFGEFGPYAWLLLALAFGTVVFGSLALIVARHLLCPVPREVAAPEAGS